MTPTHHTTNFIGGSFSAYLTMHFMDISLLDISPSSAGIDNLIAILASGIVSISTQYLLMRWSKSKSKRKTKCNDE